ncbi:sensor histidine kinase [Jidongwangia harbinensis]|uniref:sensor histidine kinase n=1 Tax=Jidongwangia harbinensis TaxID=2878561 RepID=UPI001CDA08E7|nr:HAMP domain-containing sensor histidine kinase [Jidongwangia harbinensis]MCA2213082.1 HAMP domain-containing histidine kinase [Jidongwangia harbinensis]
MSSSPPTEAPATPARRGPGGWSLRTRLVAVIIGLLSVLGLVVGGTAEIYLHASLYDRLNAQLAEMAQRVTGGPGSRPGPWPGRPVLADSPPPGVPPGSVVLTRIDTGDPDTAVLIGGLVVFRPGDTDPVGSGPQPRLDYETLSDAAVATLAAVPPGARPVDVDLGTGVGDYRVVAGTGARGAVVVVGLPLAETQKTLLQAAAVTGGVVLLALLVAGWAGAVIVRRTLAPLERVAATATRVSELRLDRGEVDLAQRVPEPDADARTEVGQVGAALNRMLDHVGSALAARHRSETQVRQFVADASHELRTPLAAIRGYAELSRRSRRPVPDEVAHVLRRVESEAHRMTTLVEDMLLLARLDAGRPLAHEPVDLTMLTVDAVSDAHAAGPRHDWQLALPEDPVVVVGDGARLHQVLANLLANARTHTPDGTTVTVGVRADGDVALLTVTDAGPGIPAPLLPHVFERFARGDGSRSRSAGSTGLGLSIVHAVVSAHGGTVSVDSAPGHTEFLVRLPLNRQPPAAEILAASPDPGPGRPA